MPMAAAAVDLLLMVATAHGIRLDAESKVAFNKQIANKSGDKGVVVKTNGEQSGEEEPVETGVVNKADGAEPSSGEEVEEAISEEKERAGHRMPGIHVDYYGTILRISSCVLPFIFFHFFFR